MSVKLFRLGSDDEGTYGVIVFNGQFLYTGEPPWRDNRRNESCIPAGVYEVHLYDSPKYGSVYLIRQVEGRSHILLHHGNYFGDRAGGLRSNTSGCVLLGRRKGRLSSQRAVLASRTARRRFENEMNGQPFQLEIYDGVT